jgi:MoaA/NifB/PqqE/SkfB family radical SAM enzyme
MKECISQFHQIGLSGVEFTGGGEPTLHPQFNEIVEFCYDIGLKVGLCTNGAKLDKVKKLGIFLLGETWHVRFLRRLRVSSSAVER